MGIVKLVILFLLAVSAGYAQIWEQTDGPANAVVWAIGIDDEDIIYAADNAILYKSKDDGDSWEFVYNWSSVATEIVSIVFNDSSDILVGTWGGAGVYRSTDEGETWLIPNTALPNVNHIAVGHNNDIIAATMLNVWISTDHGFTWEQKNVGLPAQTIVMTVHMDKNGDYFIGTYSGLNRIYKSTDYGNSWNEADDGILFFAVGSIEHNSENKLFAGGLDALGIQRSTDGGVFWEYITNGLPITAVDYIVKSNSIDHLFVGLTTGGVYKSTNDGDNWFDYNSGLLLNTILSLESNSMGVLFAGTAGNGIFRTVQSTLRVEPISTNIPSDFYLFQNYPNPFNPITEINYTIPHNLNVILKIFDTLGREITTLIDEQVEAGEHSTTFCANNLPSGVYYYSLIAGKYSQTKKMILLK